MKLFGGIVLKCLTVLSIVLLSSKLDAEPLAISPVQTDASERPVFSVGLGFPDVRARLRVYGPIDVEAKAAFGDGIQAYGGRLYGSLAKIWVLGLEAGAEAGWINFSGVETLSGSGTYVQPFAGLRYDVSRRWALSLDVGPSYIGVTSQGESFHEMEWIVNTALYFNFY